MKKFKVEVKWGITFVIAQLIWITFEKFMGWHDEDIDVQGVYSLFFAVIAFLIYYASESLIYLKLKRFLENEFSRRSNKQRFRINKNTIYES